MNPDATDSSLREVWNKLSEEQKEPFETAAKKDEERYENEHKQLKEKGYFID